MNIIEKAKELGLMLAESKEFIRMTTAEQAQSSDPDAQLLMAAYNKTRESLMSRAQSPDITPQELQAIRGELEQEHGKLMQSPSISEYIAAMGEFNSLMQGVNSAIAFYISPQDDCGGDCGGCSGCH